MFNHLNVANMTNSELLPRYIVLEDGICYDWDDYDVWGSVAYDTLEKKIVTDKYGHGTPSVMGSKTHFDEIPDDIVNEIIDCIFNELGLGTVAPEEVCLRSKSYPIAVPCNVVRGRKYKGEAILMYGVTERQRYGLGRYQGLYNHYPVILTPDGQEIRLSSFGYLEFSDDVKKIWSDTVRKTITRSDLGHLAHIYAYRMSYSACDTRHYTDAILRYRSAGMNGVYGNAMQTVSDFIVKDAEMKAAEFEALKATKMQELIDWVKTNTDKQGDEIEALAEHIFYKNYVRK